MTNEEKHEARSLLAQGFGVEDILHKLFVPVGEVRALVSVLRSFKKITEVCRGAK